MFVTYSGTWNYYAKMLPAIGSLLEHNDVEKIFLLIEDDVFPYKLPDRCEIVNIRNQKYFTETCPNINTPYTYMSMIRACYCDLLPVDRVIQLDVDTIVLDSLEDMWSKDLAGKWFAAVPEYKGKWNPWKKPYYFNTGVSVWNLNQMRKDGAQELFVRALNTFRLPFIEQDVFNYFGVPDKCAVLPIRYNEAFCTGESVRPAIIHYAGYADWWDNDQIPRHEILREYRRKYPPMSK